MSRTLHRATTITVFKCCKNNLVPNNFFSNVQVVRQLSTTLPRNGLDEFFEEEKFLGEQKVRVGRSWKKDELRLKSNEDLHKLWFVLLKERNMLLTMETAYEDEYVPMPNPERVDKVNLDSEKLVCNVLTLLFTRLLRVWRI